MFYSTYTSSIKGCTRFLLIESKLVIAGWGRVGGGGGGAARKPVHRDLHRLKGHSEI